MYDLISDWVHNVPELHEFIRTHRVNTGSVSFRNQVLEIAIREDSPELVGEYVRFGGDLGAALRKAVPGDCIGIVQAHIGSATSHRVISFRVDDVGPRTGPFMVEYLRNRDQYSYHLAVIETIKCAFRRGEPNPYPRTRVASFAQYHMYEFACAIACHSPLNEDLFLRYWKRSTQNHHTLVCHMISEQKKHGCKHPNNILRAIELTGSRPEEFKTNFLESGWSELIESIDPASQGNLVGDNNKSYIFLCACRGGHAPTIERLWPRGKKASRDGILELINCGITEPLRDRMGWRYDLGRGRCRTTRLSRYLKAHEPGAQRSVVELDLREYLEDGDIENLWQFGSRDANDALLEYLGKSADEKWSNEGGWYLEIE